MKVYICGPMRGKPKFNYPAFYEAAELVRKAGHTVFNPAEQDTIVYGLDCELSDGGMEAAGVTVRDLLASDLAWICAHADCIVTLRGFTRSLGGTAEVATAAAIGIPVYSLKYFLENVCSD
jgi:hypothetical protein